MKFRTAEFTDWKQGDTQSFSLYYFTLLLVTNMQALGELSEKKQPWQNIVAICTTDIWDHILFDTQYVVATPPKPNFLYFQTSRAHTHTHTNIPLFFLLLMKLSVFGGNKIRLEPSRDDCSCSSAHTMIRIGPGKSPTLQFLASRMLFPERDP